MISLGVYTELGREIKQKFQSHSCPQTKRNLTCLLNIARRNYQKTIDNIQSSLEQESRSKQEIMKARKKLEADINEYEVALEIANRNNQEGQKLVKKLQSQVKVTYTSSEESIHGTFIDEEM